MPDEKPTQYNWPDSMVFLTSDGPLKDRYFDPHTMASYRATHPPDYDTATERVRALRLDNVIVNVFEAFPFLRKEWVTHYDGNPRHPARCTGQWIQVARALMLGFQNATLAENQNREVAGPPEVFVFAATDGPFKSCYFIPPLAKPDDPPPLLRVPFRSLTVQFPVPWSTIVDEQWLIHYGHYNELPKCNGEWITLSRAVELGLTNRTLAIQNGVPSPG